MSPVLHLDFLNSPLSHCEVFNSLRTRQSSAKPPSVSGVVDLLEAPVTFSARERQALLQG